MILSVFTHIWSDWASNNLPFYLLPSTQGQCPHIPHAGWLPPSPGKQGNLCQGSGDLHKWLSVLSLPITMVNGWFSKTSRGGPLRGQRSLHKAVNFYHLSAGWEWGKWGLSGRNRQWVSAMSLRSAGIRGPGLISFAALPGVWAKLVALDKDSVELEGLWWIWKVPGTSFLPYFKSSGTSLDRLQNSSAQQQCDSVCPRMFLKLLHECPQNMLGTHPGTAWRCGGVSARATIDPWETAYKSTLTHFITWAEKSELHSLRLFRNYDGPLLPIGAINSVLHLCLSHFSLFHYSGPLSGSLESLPE